MGKEHHVFGWLSLKGNPSKKEWKKGAPLGNCVQVVEETKHSAKQPASHSQKTSDTPF